MTTHIDNKPKAWLSENILCYESLKRFFQNDSHSFSKYISQIKNQRKKGIIAIYGNCQAWWLVKLAETSSSITSKYMFLWLGMVHRLDDDIRENGFDKYVLQLVDLFIFQNVQVSEKHCLEISSDYILKHIRGDAIKICIPNVYFSGYFPQYCHNPYNHTTDNILWGDVGLFPYGDLNIQNMMMNASKDVITQKLIQEDYYSHEQCELSVSTSLDELRSREKLCDVTISDYIFANYRFIRLFYTNNHPCNVVLKELLVRTFKNVQIDCRDIDISRVPENDICEQFVYPSVIKHLELNWGKAKNTFIYNKDINSIPSDMYGYVSAYIDYCKDPHDLKTIYQVFGHKLYIWGTGKDASELISTNPYLFSMIEGFIDSNKKLPSEQFNGKPVYTNEEIGLTINDYVIVATRQYYTEISNYLMSIHLRYMDDYCDYFCAWEKWRIASKNTVYNDRISSFFEYTKNCKKWIPDLEPRLRSNLIPFREYVLYGELSLEQTVILSVVDRDKKTIQLNDAVIEYESEEDLATIFQEILINEDYYFECESETPCIIDGGANIGLAIYYFINQYPKCRIKAFEPNEKSFAILERNVKRNNWVNVELFRFALDSEEGERTFHIQASSLAGSLEDRNLENYNGKVVDKLVKTTVLNKYIGEHVDYLKLDIEGSETKVIEKLGILIQKVDYCFIEFHEGALKGDNSIARLLAIFENNGFTVNVGKASAFSKGTIYRPMKFVGKRISEVIWARRVF